MALEEQDAAQLPVGAQLAARLRHYEGQVALLEVRLLAAEQDNARVGELEEALRSALHEVDVTARALQEHRVAGEAQRAALAAEIDHLRGVMAALQGSLSWRITRPLRRLKRAAGRP